MPTDELVYRPVEPDDWRQYCAVVEPAWGMPFADADAADLLALTDLRRTLAVWDGPRIVATCQAHALRLSVPGGEVRLAGLSFGQVVPTHRRKGILRELIRRLHDQAREAGEPLAGGWPSVSGLHAAFGWGPATRALWLELDLAQASFLEDEDPSGSVQMLDPAEVFGVVPPIYDSARRRCSGMPDRSTARWEQWVAHDPWHWRGPEWTAGTGPRFVAVWRDGRGYLSYRVQERWSPGGPEHRVLVGELVTTDDEALRGLWRWACGLHLARSVIATQRPVDDPLPAMLVDPRRMAARGVDGLWLRVLDVAKALEGRRYGADGEVVLEVHDRAGPWAGGRYAMGVDAGECRCVPTSALPDVVLPVSALSAAYLGGRRFTEIARGGGIDVEDPRDLERLDRIFYSSPHPWCPAAF